MSATIPAQKLMTADEFWDFCNKPENENRSLELVRGKVVEASRSNRRRGFVSARIGCRVLEWADAARQGYVVTNNSGVLLQQGPDTVVGPDVAYFPGGNTVEDVHPRWGAGEPPLLAVEVLTPNDRVSRMNARVLDYLRNGVRLVWVVDYEDRQVTIYRPNQSHTMVSVGDTLDGNPELPGFTCPVAELFRLPGERGPIPHLAS